MRTDEATALAWPRDFGRTGAHAALSDEARRALPGAARVLAVRRVRSAALGDGVDPSDLAAVREHAIARGLRADYVDEFLPPEPTWLGDRWLWPDRA